MSKLLVVFGATGNQGGSVITQVINDAELSKQFKIRALTRDTTKPAAQDLSDKGIEVVSVDLTNHSSIQKAVTGAHTVFSVTTSRYDATAYETEYSEGKAIADAAAVVGAYLIFSTSPSVLEISQGKFKQVVPFNVKADLETYIRSLPIQSAFFAPGSFMQNYYTHSEPRPMGDGTYALMNILNPDTPLPLIDVKADTGKWVTAILAQPDEYAGKFFAAASQMATLQQVAETMSMVTGKKVVYKQIPDEQFKAAMPAGTQEMRLQMFQYGRDCYYFGPKQAEQVEWASKAVRGKLTTFEAHLQQNHIKLE